MRSDKLIDKRFLTRISAGIVLAASLVTLVGCARNGGTGAGKPLQNNGLGGTPFGDSATQNSGLPGTEELPTSGESSKPGTTPGNTPGGNTIHGGSTPGDSDTVEPDPGPEDQGLRIERISTFTGKFMEDGSGRPVENVAAILVTNLTDRYLDIANITYDVDGETATFVATGLPAKASAWVLEQTGMTVNRDKSLRYAGCISSFRDEVSTEVEEITIKADGTMLQATNNTDKPLQNVFVYYKNLHTDGNYLGGIAYAVYFDTIEPGETVEKLAGHYVEGSTRFVRIGWQEGQSDDGS